MSSGSEFRGPRLPAGDDAGKGPPGCVPGHRSGMLSVRRSGGQQRRAMSRHGCRAAAAGPRLRGRAGAGRRGRRPDCDGPT
jgi:hypothetical protein